ncbi:hypothetical protein E2C01_088445 [Portunus trituberculatus]|uniref:Uncharacterized protein n=1 Tax=Portunus trituberculatus TaxID=210409 RepID=A0A5B7J672_PORTR|nr:hypothetical protein [Portunus trituberculatus]
MPHPRLRTRLHPAVEPSAASSQPRRSARKDEEPSLPL